MLRKLVCVTDDEGKQVISVLRALIGVMATVLIGASLTWFAWVTQQAYDVATNKKLIADTAERLERKIDINSQNIILDSGEVEDEFDKVNRILHTRITNVDEKYDEKVTKLHEMLMETNKLIINMLIQQSKEVQLKQQEVDIKEQQLMDDK